MGPMVVHTASIQGKQLKKVKEDTPEHTHFFWKIHKLQKNIAKVWQPCYFKGEHTDKLESLQMGLTAPKTAKTRLQEVWKV